MIPENGITCESFKRKKKSSNKNAAWNALINIWVEERSKYFCVIYIIFHKTSENGDWTLINNWLVSMRLPWYIFTSY
jgi:hypothetical protein